LADGIQLTEGYKMENFALVIEDDEDLSAIFVKALEAAGFKAEAIRDGKLAQQRLQETTPRVIVLDMHLPHVDGAILLKQIQETPELNNTKIILATADNVRAELYRDKANIVLVKPISFSQLRDLSARLKL
jgi:DNA-binding response OmpR family regulator